MVSSFKTLQQHVDRELLTPLTSLMTQHGFPTHLGIAGTPWSLTDEGAGFRVLEGFPWTSVTVVALSNQLVAFAEAEEHDRGERQQCIALLAALRQAQGIKCATPPSIPFIGKLRFRMYDLAEKSTVDSLYTELRKFVIG
jgi:hypothetical protein